MNSGHHHLYSGSNRYAWNVDEFDWFAFLDKDSTKTDVLDAHYGLLRYSPQPGYPQNYTEKALFTTIKQRHTSWPGCSW